MKTTVLLCLLLFTTPLYGWGKFTHRLMARESLRKAPQEWQLNKPVAITPFDSFLKKLSTVHPDIKTKEDFADWLRINKQSPFDKPEKQEVGRMEITPLEILTLYAQRADDGRDQDLPYDKRDQFWFGSGTKTGSQAFRHMEKAPFNLLHPLNTFGFPLGTVGQASKRAQLYFNLAVTAYQLNEPYWAWNFLGVGLHYIQDLQNPYHSAQLLLPTAIQGIISYLDWGKKEHWGLIKTVTHITANLHHFFEGYVDYQLQNYTEMGAKWIQELRYPFFEMPENKKTARQLAEIIRDYSNAYAYSLVRKTLQLTGNRLLTSKAYTIDNTEEERFENPKPYFIQKEQTVAEVKKSFEKIGEQLFRYQGRVSKRYVGLFIEAVRVPNL